DQLEPSSSQDRHVGRLLAVEDATGVDAGLANQFGIARPIAHQAAGFGILSERIDRGHGMSRLQRGKLHPATDEHGVGTDHGGVSWPFYERQKSCVDVAT